MRVGMAFRRFSRMVFGMERMAMRDMRVMASLVMVAVFVVFGCFAVMFGCELVMLGGRLVMRGLGIAGHCRSPWNAASRAGTLSRAGVDEMTRA
jgi:hypothetical protein